jgi:hypothetical protein
MCKAGASFAEVLNMAALLIGLRTALRDFTEKNALIGNLLHPEFPSDQEKISDFSKRSQFLALVAPF